MQRAMPYARTRLGRLFYEERGEAKKDGDPAIVLLHALLFDGGMWRGQVEPLSDLGRVVVIDGPGHGRSETMGAFTLEEHADAVADVLEELGISSAVFVGLSWGGMVAMRIALQHPKLVAGLALIDTSAEGEKPKLVLRARIALELYRRLGFPYPIFERYIAPFMYVEHVRRERPELVDATYRRIVGYDRDGVVHASRAVVERTNVLDRLGAIRVPTLVICGREDRTTPLRRSRNLSSAIAGSSLVVLERTGHVPALEDPKTINELVVPFVRELVGV